MKKICLFLLGVITIAACSKRAQEPSQSILASNFGVNVHNFSSDANTKVTTDPNKPYTFNWQSTDKIGVFPLTVDDRQKSTQLGCTLIESISASQAKFQGSGWGLICNGNYKYASYYPYSKENSVNEIKVSFPANLAVNNRSTSHIAPYVHMYAPAIKPTNVEAANFNFYQVGALAHFEITTPAGVQYTKLVISTASNVFTTEGTYDLAAVTSENKPVIIPKTQVNAIGMSLNVTLEAGENLDLYFIMAPAQLKNQTLNFKLFDGNNKKYTGTMTCKNDQVSGKIYRYSVTLTEESVQDPETIEGVDLGHPFYLFAPFNLGATSIEETGDFFAWGEVAKKETFTAGNYALSSIPSYYDALQDTTVNINNKTYKFKVFKPAYDAAAQKWGNGWMIPNYQEINDFLQSKCNKVWVTINGTQGWKCYNSEDDTKWIFLPATGVKVGSKVDATDQGFYWTSYITGEDPKDTAHYAEYCRESSPKNMGITRSRYNGLAIRPVKLKNNNK